MRKYMSYMHSFVVRFYEINNNMSWLIRRWLFFPCISLLMVEAAFSGPPVNIVLKSRGKHSLDISWKAPSDDSIHIGVLIGYRVCFSTRNNTPECSTTMSNTYTLYNLRPSTKYFVTVAVGTLVGYGNHSLIRSKITNGVMVIVKIATSNPTPSEDIETNELKPHNLSIQEQPYVAVHMRTEVLPLTFAVGDGKEYISENEKYLNHPLKPNSNYIMFLRFFESKDSYYSTQWSNSVKTLVKPPVEYVDNQTFEVQSSNNKIHADLIVPLVIVSFCFLFALGVIVYQHINQRRILQKHKQSSHKFQRSKHADQNKRFDAIQETADYYESIECVKTGAKRLNENDVHTYATPDETFARGEKNGCQSVPARSAGQESSNYMPLKSNRETENFYHRI